MSSTTQRTTPDNLVETAWRWHNLQDCPLIPGAEADLMVTERELWSASYSTASLDSRNSRQSSGDNLRTMGHISKDYPDSRISRQSSGDSTKTMGHISKDYPDSRISKQSSGDNLRTMGHISKDYSDSRVSRQSSGDSTKTMENSSQDCLT